MIWQAVGRFFANLLAHVFKDWRRDQELIEKGRNEQRLDNLEEGELRRKDADQIKREAEAGETIVEDDEL